MIFDAALAIWFMAGAPAFRAGFGSRLKASSDRSLTTVLGRRVSYVDLSEDAMREGLLRFGFPQWQADGLIEDYALYRKGEASAVSSAVQDVTGQPPRSFEQFAQVYSQAFRP